VNGIRNAKIRVFLVLADLDLRGSIPVLIIDSYTIVDSHLACLQHNGAHSWSAWISNHIFSYPFELCCSEVWSRFLYGVSCLLFFVFILNDVSLYTLNFFRVYLE